MVDHVLISESGTPFTEPDRDLYTRTGVPIPAVPLEQTFTEPDRDLYTRTGVPIPAVPLEQTPRGRDGDVPTLSEAFDLYRTGRA